jgi:predicted O-methyltransferase YrrM
MKLKTEISSDSSVSQAQMSKLYDLAKRSQYPILEFGCLRGRSTLCLAQGSKDGNQVPVHAIDPFAFDPTRALTTEEEKLYRPGYDPVAFNISIFDKHMREAGVENLVTAHTMSLMDFSFEQPINLLFVDANKKREGLNHLWAKFWKRLVPGGWFCVHDFKWDTSKEPGAKKGLKFRHIKEWFDLDLYPRIGRKINYIEIVNSMLVIHKS